MQCAKTMTIHLLFEPGRWIHVNSSCCVKQLFVPKQTHPIRQLKTLNCGPYIESAPRPQQKHLSIMAATEVLTQQVVSMQMSPVE